MDALEFIQKANKICGIFYMCEYCPIMICENSEDGTEMFRCYKEGGLTTDQYAEIVRLVENCQEPQKRGFVKGV